MTTRGLQVPAQTHHYTLFLPGASFICSRGYQDSCSQWTDQVQAGTTVDTLLCPVPSQSCPKAKFVNQVAILPDTIFAQLENGVLLGTGVDLASSGIMRVNIHI